MIQQITSKLPIGARVDVASPISNRQYYVELQCNTGALIVDVKNVKRFVEFEYFDLARNQFDKAKGSTFREIKKFRDQPTLFEAADCTIFGEAITDIEKELQITENRIYALKKSDPNYVNPITRSLNKITDLGNGILATVDGRFLCWQSQSVREQSPIVISR